MWILEGGRHDLTDDIHRSTGCGPRGVSQTACPSSSLAADCPADGTREDECTRSPWPMAPTPYPNPGAIRGSHGGLVSPSLCLCKGDGRRSCP